MIAGNERPVPRTTLWWLVLLPPLLVTAAWLYLWWQWMLPGEDDPMLHRSFAFCCLCGAGIGLWTARTGWTRTRWIWAALLAPLLLPPVLLWIFWPVVPAVLLLGGVGGYLAARRMGRRDPAWRIPLGISLIPLLIALTASVPPYHAYKLLWPWVSLRHRILEFQTATRRSCGPARPSTRSRTDAAGTRRLGERNTAQTESEAGRHQRGRDHQRRRSLVTPPISSRPCLGVVGRTRAADVWSAQCVVDGDSVRGRLSVRVLGRSFCDRVRAERLDFLQQPLEAARIVRSPGRHADCSFHRQVDDVSSSPFDMLRAAPSGAEGRPSAGGSMTEERLDRIEHRLDGLASEMAEVKSGLTRVRTELAEVKTDLTEVRTDLAEVKTDLIEVKTDLIEVKTDLSKVKADLTGVKSEVTGLKTELIQVRDDLSREMRFLFEQTNENIKALTLPVPELERRWKADDAALREDIERRLDPLEAAVRKQL